MAGMATLIDLLMKDGEIKLPNVVESKKKVAHKFQKDALLLSKNKVQNKDEVLHKKVVDLERKHDLMQEMLRMNKKEIHSLAVEFHLILQQLCSKEPSITQPVSRAFMNKDKEFQKKVVDLERKQELVAKEINQMKEMLRTNRREIHSLAVEFHLILQQSYAPESLQLLGQSTEPSRTRPVYPALKNHAVAVPIQLYQHPCRNINRNLMTRDR
ncbi:hypothetical protein QQ045_020007 [Rhodiola kirilowii]